MSEILTKVRRAFCEVDMVDLKGRQEAEKGQHESSVSSLEQEAAALEERAYAIKKVHDELAPYSLGIERPALNQMLAEVEGYLDEARKFRDRVSAKDSKHGKTISMLGAQADLGTKYPRILIQDVLFVERGTTQFVILPIPLWSSYIKSRALLSSYQKTQDCYDGGGSEEWFKSIQLACRRQAGQSDKDCRIGTHQVNERSRYVFPGLIPPEIKKKIEDAKSDFRRKKFFFCWMLRHWLRCPTPTHWWWDGIQMFPIHCGLLMRST